MLIERPKIKLQLSPTDKVLEFAGTALLATLWTYLLLNYTSLPDIIPIHFNGKGEMNGQGAKGMLIGLPVVATILFAGLTILNRFPHLFNYPSTLTAANAHQQYSNATRFLRIMNIIIVVVFMLIVWKVIHIANGQATGLGIGFLPLVLGLIFIPTIAYVIIAIRRK